MKLLSRMYNPKDEVMKTNKQTKPKERTDTYWSIIFSGDILGKVNSIFLEILQNLL